MKNYEFELNTPEPYDQVIILELIRRMATINGGILKFVSEIGVDGHQEEAYESWDWVTYIKFGSPNDYKHMMFSKVGFNLYECRLRIAPEVK